MIQFFYTFFLYPLVFLVFWLLSFKDPKVREGFRLRRHQAWLVDFPTNTRWVWFHVASGELEYAKPVINQLKKPGVLPADTKILVTYFSPSVQKALQKTKDVDLFVPMPWDTPWHWKRFLHHYKPLVLAIARTDTWPNMVWESTKAKIPSILFSATLPAQSGRYATPWVRFFYGKIIGQLTYVSCVAEEDRRHFLRLEKNLNVSVDGDTRFDQVIARVQENRPTKAFLENFGPALVAGSTWPEDEKVLLPALKKPVEQGLKVIIAPHEPTPPHLEALQKNFASLGISTQLYTQIDKVTATVVIIDQVGILADLYRAGQLAFVGGSFKKSIHSVMEPAASGCLTLVGPFHHNNREALALKTLKFVVEVKTTEDLEKIILADLALSKTQITSRKNEIQSFVEKNKGVSLKIARWILERIS